TMLDWDKFYSHFPIIKRLSKKFHTKEDIYTQNFAKQIEIILQKTHNILTLKELPQGEYKFDFAIDIREERSDKNEESYIIIKENDEIPKGYKRILDCKPYEIDTLNCQLVGIKDEDFFYQILQNLGIDIAAQFNTGISLALLARQMSKLIPYVGTSALAYDAYLINNEISEKTYN
ncbi:hypothetical protein H2279_08715, partial [Campylobacter sp. B0100352/1]|uniref:hypothetical protein n=1 Tax=Campylobacter sp. B0100352/1 TaxID=2735783 RepID=UPI001D4FDF98|nr:hypothetical protein [Campylobacter sp. B0100352/1]